MRRALRPDPTRGEHGAEGRRLQPAGPPRAAEGGGADLQRPEATGHGRAASTDRCILEVEDNGRGFAPQKSRSKGWGLRNPDERANALGGEMEIFSNPGEGSIVRLMMAM